jgi:hypothetical protein
MGIRWLKIKSNTEMWEATGEKLVMLTVTMIKF